MKLRCSMKLFYYQMKFYRRSKKTPFEIRMIAAAPFFHVFKKKLFSVSLKNVKKIQPKHRIDSATNYPKNSTNSLNCFWKGKNWPRIALMTVGGWIRVFTNSIGPIYKKDNLKKKRRRALAYHICFFPSPFFYLTIDQWGCAHFLETLKNGYACVFQNVPERYLTSVKIDLAPIKPITKPTTLCVQWTKHQPPYWFNLSNYLFFNSNWFQTRLMQRFFP